MAYCCHCDILSWIEKLPPFNQWKTNPLTICILSSTSNQPSLNFSVSKNLHSPTISFSMVADFNIPIPLWTSKQFQTNPKSLTLVDNEITSSLLTNFIEDVLGYASNKFYLSVKPPRIDSNIPNFRDIFNLSFLSLSLLICIYEAPTDLRSISLAALKNQLGYFQLREAKKSIMLILGSNLEEQWMRSVNLAITNRILEHQASNQILRTPSPLFSYSVSTYGLWKVHLYCPIIAMDLENSNNSSADEKLLFSLKFHQLEGVVQFNYKVTIQEKWVDVVVNVDNIRCDIVSLLNKTLLNERGVGDEEKHFPSRITLQLTPIPQSNIISVSVSKSSENPTREIELEKGIETSFQPATPFLGLQITSAETVSMSLKPWKFEESVDGYSSILNWFLHDSVNGREVVSAKPSIMSLIKPHAWFKNRYSSAYRPFTKQGGVIFAGDEYGNSVRWKVDKYAIGKTLEWEIRGWIWVTYWPNKHRTAYCETRRLEFKEVVHLTIG